MSCEVRHMRRFHLSLPLFVALSQRNIGHLVNKQLTAYTEIQPHPGLINFVRLTYPSDRRIALTRDVATSHFCYKQSFGASLSATLPTF